MASTDAAAAPQRTFYEPSSEMAWGPKGSWATKSTADVAWETSVAATYSVANFNGTIEDSK